VSAFVALLVAFMMSAAPNMAAAKTLWKPLPGSQSLAVSCPCNHILYEGTRGPGKSEAQLMAFRKNVGRGYGAHWRGIIFDRRYKSLDDLVVKSKKLFGRFNDGARFLASKGDYKWVWPTGEELLFRVVKRADDYENYHGHEYPFIGWNELTKFPTSELFNSLMSCNRSGFVPAEHSPDPAHPLPEIPLVVFATTNPYGPGHNWVKIRFVDVAEPGQVVRIETDVFNPRTQQREKIVKTQVRIFGSYKENRYLSPQYIAELENIKDANKRKAWLWGDWDIVAGGALDDVGGPHLIKARFKIPASWRVDRTLDWGSSHPFSIGWWAEANGEEIELPDGSRWCPVKGSFVRIFEWYGTEEPGSNRGLKLGATKIADGIKEREAKLRKDGWICKDVQPGPADNEIGSVKNTDSETIKKQMSDRGVRWTDSNKSAGSRRNGLQLVRDRMEASRTGEGPGLYFMDNCRAAISTLPVLPRSDDDPDDVDTTAEDHTYDEIRYKVLSGNNRAATAVRVRFPT
jgi:hypothetical protein